MQYEGLLGKPSRCTGEDEYRLEKTGMYLNHLINNRCPRDAGRVVYGRGVGGGVSR